MKRFLMDQLGFNLIELMMVVAIIGILAAIAIPSYSHYTGKAKFTEVIQAAAPFKLAVEACAYQQSDISACVNHSDGEGKNGIPPAITSVDSKKGYVKSVAVRNGGANTVQVVAISQNIGRHEENYTYILDGIRQDNGQLSWTKDTQSSCNTAGLC